tara:strand:+ start:2610 stop:3143 length:534 start_codon:yes stop_codon:yes gene_type:complete
MSVKKIHIIGVSGSGKSWISKKLSDILKIKHYDLDDIYFERKFDKLREEKNRKKLFNKLIKKDRWIIEGTYSRWIEPSIKKSDLVIWMDSPLHVLFVRIFCRFLGRRKSDNKEKFWWVLQLMNFVRKYKKKTECSGYHKHKSILKKHKVDFIYLKNKKEVGRFLKNFKKKYGVTTKI